MGGTGADRVGADILRYLINEAKTKADEILTQSNDNWKCKPPCGFQKNARRFYCKTCVEEDCDLPVDCAIHDIDISELDKVDLECTVNYNLPEDKSVTWQFGRNIRSTDLSNFKIIHIGEDTSLLIKPIRSYHRGTYTCQISDDEDVLIRKYFYLNVSRNEYGADTYLEDVFYVVLNTNVTHEEQPPGFKVHSLSDLISLKKSLGLTTRIFLTLGVALLFMLLTLLIGAGYLYATDVE
ncbi:sperm acrosome membrane-associated protein 6 isoform X2 [Ascaphus truei]|uniref:sperm acrosome membrane-associated protein 6 isoform X2 n=1 Tax=Ascaphus truei TaxID=8439 RepID=UPI003F59314B